MKLILLILSISILFFSGCATLSDISAEPDGRRSDRAELERAVESLERENARLNTQLQHVRLESENIRNRESALGRELADLRAREERLREQLASNEAAQRNIEGRLAETEKRLSGMVAERQSQQEDLKKIADDFSRSLRGLGLFTVEQRGGEVRVVLPTVLAFTGGEVRIVDGGRPILRGVAGVLNNHPDKRVIVEGHTDDIPISRTYSSNWELSFSRALTVLEFLEGEGVDPMRMSAAGFGKYMPRASNSSASGRAENRRVEIVVRSGS